MSAEGRAADRLRRQHMREHGIEDHMVLPWELLQESEQRRWLEQAAREATT